MSSSVVYAQGNKAVTVAANESIAVYSKAACQVYRRTGYPQFPTQDVLLGTVSDTETVFGPYTSGATIVVTPGASDAMYEVGVAPRVMEVASNWTKSLAPIALNTTGALTAAMILNGIITSTTGAAVAGTVPVGTVMDAAADFAIGDEVRWSVINTGGSNDFTVTTDTNHTLVGVMVVQENGAGFFLTRKTDVATYVTYRMAGA